jgi:hypothetical protein
MLKARTGTLRVTIEGIGIDHPMVIEREVISWKRDQDAEIREYWVRGERRTDIVGGTLTIHWRLPTDLKRTPG